MTSSECRILSPSLAVKWCYPSFAPLSPRNAGRTFTAISNPVRESWLREHQLSEIHIVKKQGYGTQLACDAAGRQKLSALR